MYIKAYFLIYFFTLSNLLIAQKKSIDNFSYQTWASLKEIDFNKSSIVSNDGKYLIYKYAVFNRNFLVLQSIDGRYKKEFPEPIKASFTTDSRRLIILLQKDSLAILSLGTSKIIYISDATSYAIPKMGNGQWLAYRKKSNSELIIKNLFTGEDNAIADVEEYMFSDNGETALIKNELQLLYLNLLEGYTKTIFTGENISNITFDNSGMQFAFIVSKSTGNEIRYYKKGLDSAKVLVDSSTTGFQKSFEVANDELRFTKDGSKLFFELKQKIYDNHFSSKNILTKSTIWNFKDKFIGRTNFPDENIIAITRINNPEIIQLTTGETSLMSYNYSGKYCLTGTKINSNEFYWNAQVLSVYLVSLEDGRKREIANFSKALNIPCFCLSPSQDFFLWFDAIDKQYFSYDISTGQIKNISEKIPVDLFDGECDIPARRSPFGIGGWADKKNVLVYDKFDIWKIDITGTSEPVNITKKFGRQNNIALRIVNDTDNSLILNHFLIYGFNRDNKQNGFLKYKCDEDFKPCKEAFGDYIYYGNFNNQAIGYFTSWLLPIKCANKELYMVTRMSSSESPNIFITEDFVKYKRITNIHPEKEYNWLTTELINWYLPDGRRSSGILYKPENFDSSKKYPVIFHFYEKNSDELNMFKSPRLSYGNINIPWYVSNGYIVFVPDIQYKSMDNATSIVNTIKSSLDVLKKHSWIDTNRLGLQGHSFGGYETVLLLTQINSFKAAQESAGPINLVSFYSHINNETSRQMFCEFDQFNLGTTPWDNPILYINSSPIFKVNNIETPLLIMHGKKDHIVSISQSTEIFAALRRLGKQTWLLQYDDESHTIENQNKQLDFNEKQQQFFNYFLKDTPIPDWMK